MTPIEPMVGQISDLPTGLRQPTVPGPESPALRRPEAFPTEKGVDKWALAGFPIQGLADWTIMAAALTDNNPPN
jgi:hypothetical protein